MASVDSLPGDQRAVLQLVLGRGRSYDEIARLLSINPEAVRERALAALDTLGPQTKVDRDSRAQICDYLLGQLPESQHDEVRDRLAESAPDRAWARVVSSELASVASGPLPEIPAETSAARAAHQPSPPPVPARPPAASEAAGPADAADAGPSESAPASEGEKKRGRLGRREREPKAPRAAKPPREPKAPREPKPPREAKPPRESKRSREPKPVLSSDAGASGPRSSRLGGLIVIGVAVVIVVVVVIIVVGSGGSSNPSSSSTTTTAAAAPPTTASTAASTSAAAPATSGTSTSSTSAKVIAQINLTPPTTAAGSKAAGIAEVLKEGSTDGIAIVAQGVAANTTKPANAYAVWLYNSPTDAKILGFVNPGVSSTGKLSTAGGLPANASHYKQLIVTLETAANPKAPGTVILQGTLTGLS